MRNSLTPTVEQCIVLGVLRCNYMCDLGILLLMRGMEVYIAAEVIMVKGFDYVLQCGVAVNATRFPGSGVLLAQFKSVSCVYCKSTPF